MPTASWGRSFGKKAKGRGRGNTGEKGRRGISGHVSVTIPPPQTPTTACVKRFGQAKQQLPEPGKQGPQRLRRKLPFSLHPRCPSRSTETPGHPQELSLSPSLPSLLLLLAHEPLPFLAPKQLAAWGPALLAGARGVSW